MNFTCTDCDYASKWTDTVNAAAFFFVELP
jgi:hypothetical protein